MNWSSTAAGGVAALCFVLSGVSLGQNNDWQGPNQGNWADDANWTLGQPTDGEAVRHLSALGGLNIQRGLGTEAPQILSFEAQVPDAQARSLTFLPLPTSGNALLSHGAIFRTATGTGTYTMHLRDNSSITAGDQNGGPDIGDMYGFKVAFEGVFAGINAPSVMVERTLGWGAVDLLGNFQGFVTASGAPFATPGFFGTIDCAYNPGGSAIDPRTQSQWRIGNGTDPYQFTVRATSMLNVGDWLFRPDATTPFTNIDVTVFDMYNNPLDPSVGGILETHNVDPFTISNVGLLGLPLAAPAPLARFDGTSQWRYGPGSGNKVFFSTLENAATLEFTNRPSLLKPTGYPTAPLTTVSLEFHASGGEMVRTKVLVGSKVAREALAFDAALADWFNKNSLELEMFTPDICNVQFMDHLVPDGSNPVTCLPKYNRCVKAWNDLDMLEFSPPNLLTLRDDVVSNQEPEYTPANYPREACYWCDVLGPNNPNQVVSEPPGLNLRLYARTASTGFPAVLLSLTRYFDANVDFDVDLHDWLRFQNSFTGVGKPTWNPLADFGTTEADPSADCDCDIQDFLVLRKRWHGSGTGYMVCAAGSLPSGNVNQPNGDPDIVVCGGPLHVRPQGLPGQPATAPPALNCPNCSLYPFPCGGLTNCGGACPWDSTSGDFGGFGFSGGGGGGFEQMGAPAELGEEAGALSVPAEPLTPAAQMAAIVLAHADEIDVEQIAELLVADGLANGDAYVLAVAEALGF